jgi:branched-chain amino acid transport system permease protein
VGTAAFMAIGAYTATILHLQAEFPFWAAVLAGGVMAGLLGIIAGLPCLILQGDYLLMATFGFAEVTRVVLLNLDITNGALGISGIPPLANPFNIYLVVAGVLIVTLMLSYSKIGRAWRAIREDETAAAAMGIPTTFYKTLAFAVGSAFCGLAGALYAFLIGFISPNDFSVMLAFLVYLNLVLGGLGRIDGAIIGTILLTVLPEALRFTESYRMVLFGLALVLLVIFRPMGILGDFSIRRLFSAGERRGEDGI